MFDGWYEHLFPFNHRCCSLFYFLRRVVLPVSISLHLVERPSRRRRFPFGLRSTYAAMSARLLSVLLGAGVAAAAYWRRSCAAHLPLLMIGSVLTLAARGADFALPPSARDWRTLLLSGRGPLTAALPQPAPVGRKRVRERYCDPTGGLTPSPSACFRHYSPV